MATIGAGATVREAAKLMLERRISALPGARHRLHEVARLMEKHRIKRVPVLEAGRLVGIVSRALTFVMLPRVGAALGSV